MSEADDQRAFAKWLKSEGIAFMWQRTDKRATASEGWPDFTVLRNGLVLLIEMKTEKGPIAPVQVKMHAALELAGCRVFVTRKLSAAIELVRAWLDATAGDSVPVQQKADTSLRQSMGFVFEKRQGRWESIRRATAHDRLPAL